MRMLIRILLLAISIAGCGKQDEQEGVRASMPRGGLDGTKVDLQAEQTSPTEPSAVPGVGPSAAIALSEIKVEVEVHPDSSGYRFTNQSPGSVWYSGYGVGSPIYDLQGKQGSSDWMSILGWCGTGVEIVELQEGEVLDVEPYLDGLPDGTTGVRVGIYFSVSANGAGVEVFGAEIPAH